MVNDNNEVIEVASTTEAGVYISHVRANRYVEANRMITYKTREMSNESLRKYGLDRYIKAGD